MLNYQGKTRDVMTLAHDLGHGVHQVLAAEQGALMASTPLTLAETASVFGEMLTFQSLLKQTDGCKEAQGAAGRQGRGHDQHGGAPDRVLPVRAEVHTARREGELTAEQMGELWIDAIGSLGEAVQFGPGYETFWAYIPHFIHSPFYVYAYAFGDCLVNSLYARYLRSRRRLPAERYFEMLKAGGTKHHSELLKPFGLDASDPGFWNQGLSMIEGMIDE
jgi:oligoendopeptidase F